MVGHSTSLIARVRAVLDRFGRDENAAAAPILALALIPIIFTMGLASELSSWWLMQRSLQHAADSAVLVAATDAGNYPYTSSNFCDALSTGSKTAYACLAPTAPVNCNQATADPQHSWYCQAIAAAAKYGYVDGANTVVVTPQSGACSTYGVNLSSGFSNGAFCYKVTVTKNLPVFLLGIMGYRGTTTVAGINYQQIGAHALASTPGPPIDFCIVTTNGKIRTTGTPSADIKKCSTYSNGDTTCTGQGIDSGVDEASGSANCNGGINRSNYTPPCIDPYSASCGTNASGNIPPPPSNCTGTIAASADALDTYDGAKDNNGFLSKNVITQADINGTATTGFNSASNASLMTVNGTQMEVIQVCGTAMLSNTTPTAVTGAPTPCSSGGPAYTSGNTSNASSYNMLIIVYDGGLDMNGCSLSNSEPTATAGGLTVIFAPALLSAGGSTLFTSCDADCYPMSSNANNSGGTISIAAPKNGIFSGIAIMQSEKYTSTSGCGGGNSGTGGTNDWCNAGNQPSLSIQGLIYMPNAALHFAGAISKFAGGLNCVAMIIKQLEINGTGFTINNFGSASITGQCTTAGVTLPGVPGSHSYYQALVG